MEDIDLHNIFENPDIFENCNGCQYNLPMKIKGYAGEQAVCVYNNQKPEIVIRSFVCNNYISKLGD